MSGAGRATQDVYREFDLDGSGEVGFDEMLALGKARRALGQKRGEWTEAMNERMMERMGVTTHTASYESVATD